MLIPLLLFIILSIISISALGWLAIIPIVVMWLILAYISDNYKGN